MYMTLGGDEVHSHHPLQGRGGKSWSGLSISPFESTDYTQRGTKQCDDEETTTEFLTVVLSNLYGDMKLNFAITSLNRQHKSACQTFKKLALPRT